MSDDRDHHGDAPNFSDFQTIASQVFIPKITNSEPLNLQGNDGSIIIRGSSAFSPFSPVPKGVMFLPSGIQSSISTPPKNPIHQQQEALELEFRAVHTQLSGMFR